MTSTKPMLPGQPHVSRIVAAPDQIEPGAVESRRPRSDRSTAPRLALVIADVAALAAAWTVPALSPPTMTLDRRVLCSVAAVIVTVLAMQHAGLYRARVCALRSSEVARTVGASLLGAGTFVVAQWLAGSVSAARALVGAAGAIVAVLLVRWYFGRWLKARRAEGRFLRTVVLVGTNEDGVTLWNMLRDEPELGYRIGAVLGDRAGKEPFGAVTGCAEIDGLVALARTVGAGGVVVVGSAWGTGASSEAVHRAMAAGLHVQVWPGFAGLSTRRLRMAPVSGVPMLYIEPKVTGPWRMGVKRAIDLTLTAALCPFVAPVLIVAALLIKLEDRGPMLHRHSVVGRGGVPITVLKLRTMIPDAERLRTHVAALNERTGGPLFKATYDPRVTRIGRVLRATSIDELPQLWNVLNGTMSLVGPRFALPYEVEEFDEELCRRTEMRPGITGLWQSEARDNPSFSVYRRLDLFYVDNWSLSLDWSILANTLHAVSVRFVRTILSLGPRRSARHPVTDDPAPVPTDGGYVPGLNGDRNDRVDHDTTIEARTRA